MANKKKIKRFTAVTAVKAAAREHVGAVPPTRLVPDQKKKRRAKEKHRLTLRKLLEDG